MLIYEILRQSARDFPDKPAVWFNGDWKTYGELSSRVDSIATFLVQHGVRPGDRVALMLENSFDDITAHFGALSAGAVEVSLNTELRASAIKELLLDCDAKVLFAGKKQSQHWLPILDELSDLSLLVVDGDVNESPVPSNIELHSLRELADTASKVNDLPDRIDIDLASIVYTSGVTGRPKGVMLTHLNIVSNTSSIVKYLQLSSTDRMLVVLPFYYIYGRSLLYTHFFSGGSLILENRFAYPVTVLNALEEHDVTCFAGVPSTFSILMSKTDFARRELPCLRLLTQAGGGMAPSLQTRVSEAVHPARLYVMYGSTEAAPRLTYLEPDMLQSKLGSIGKAIPNVEVIVVDSSARPLAVGESGEIAARGSNIMLGYWKDPEATSRVLRNGYYCTGDLGYVDEGGYLFLTGRERDFVKTGGHRVSGKEIEDEILEHPDVLESAVIGISDEILGEAMKAFVVARSSALTEQSLREHLRQSLPLFKQPKRIEIVEQLPKNQSGKVLKEMLREAN